MPKAKLSRRPVPVATTPTRDVNRTLLYLCFFASGVAGLILEIVWSKYLSYLLGNSIYGVSTVVAAFLGGLGIGAAWGGRFAGRSKAPLVAYGRLEALVGLLALASPFIFLAAPPLFAMIYDLVGGYGPGFFALRFAFLFGVLLLPTTAMGATLPLLVEHFDRKEGGPNRRRSGRTGGAVARLYAINTAGAVTGVLLAGYFLIPAHGLANSAISAAAIDFAVAALVLLSRPAPFARPGADVAATGAEAPTHGTPEAAVHGGGAALAAPSLLDRFLLPMFALSGLTAILYQVAWTRILAIPFGGMVYAFSAILALYLLGLSLGAAGAARALRRSADPWSLFAALQIGLAAAVAFGTHYFGSIPHGQATVIAASQGSMTALLLGEARIAALVVMPPTLFLGALFPVAVAIHRRRVADAGEATGAVYAANTVGSIAGSILTAFVLIPAFGTLKSILGAAAANLAMGAAALLLGGRTVVWRAGAAAAVAGALVFALAWMPDWNASRMSFGFIRLLRAHWFGGESLSHRIIDKVGTTPEFETLLFYREGRSATITVVEAQRQRALLINGKTDATTGEGADMRTQVLVGQLPLLGTLRRDDVCIVGYGSGVTAHAVMTHPIRTALTVELEGAVIEAAPLFDADAMRPLDDPRSRVLVEDAQTLLRSDKKTYDVIISEPSNLWIAGSGDLFTREFYEVAATRLRPGGIFCQWVQCYQISPEATQTVFRTLAGRFPYGQLFYIDDSSDLIVLASPDREVPLDVAVWQAAMSRPEVAADLARIGVRDFADLLRYYRGRLDRVAAEAGPGPVNTNDNGWLEHRAPFDLIASEGSERLFAWSPSVARDLVNSLTGDSATVALVLRDAAESAERANAPEAARNLRMAFDQATSRSASP